MRSLKDIMTKTASRGRNDAAVVEKRREHSTVDAIDDQFLSWMSKKASEDVVKIADCGAGHGKMKAGEKCRVCGEENKDAVKTASSCSESHKSLKSGQRCEKCGEMEKKAAPSIQAVRRVLSGAKSSNGLEEAVQKFTGREKLKSLLTGAVAGGGLTAGAGALYIKGRRDQRAKTAGVIENQENLDLLARIRARMAAGSSLVGDG